MSEAKTNALRALSELSNTIRVLQGGLCENDGEQAREAVTILLLQCMEHFGRDSPVMKQFFPVLEIIKTRIDKSDFRGAEQQTTVFAVQLREVGEIVMRS